MTMMPLILKEICCQMISYIEYLGVPKTIAIIIVGAFFIMQIIGLILDVKGKAVPAIMNLWGFFKKRKQEKEETAQTLKKVKQLLEDVNAHYSADNISKRNEWMSWVNNRAGVYDQSIIDINNKLNAVTEALKDNTKLTEELFVQNSRDRIIDFATKVGCDNVMVSREEFNRIFKVYDKYEEFLKDRGLSNGEVDISYNIIKESYQNHMKHHSFVEDIRGYK